LWAAKTPNGPSVKMHVQNVHTMDELKMTGNCLKGSRGLVSFDSAFDDTEWGRLVKELFTQVSHILMPGKEFPHLMTMTLLCLTDLWCTGDSQKSEAFCRPYTHVFLA
jgi:ribosome biogenesis protein BRX1